MWIDSADVHVCGFVYASVCYKFSCHKLAPILCIIKSNCFMWIEFADVHVCGFAFAEIMYSPNAS